MAIEPKPRPDSAAAPAPSGPAPAKPAPLKLGIDRQDLGHRDGSRPPAKTGAPAGTEAGPAKAEPAKPEPAKPEPAKSEPATPAPIKSAPAKPESAAPEPAKPQLARPALNSFHPPNAASPKPAPVKPAPVKPAPVKPDQAQPGPKVPFAFKPLATAKPADAKPADTKPADAKPADAKPVAAKPADAKPVDVKPVAAKPADAKPVDAKPFGFDLKPFDLGAFDLGPLDFSLSRTAAEPPASPAAASPAPVDPPSQPAEATPSPPPAEPPAAPQAAGPEVARDAAEPNRPAQSGKPRAEPSAQPAPRDHRPFVLDAPPPRIAKPGVAAAQPGTVTSGQGSPRWTEFKWSDTGWTESRRTVSPPAILGPAETEAAGLEAAAPETPVPEAAASGVVQLELDADLFEPEASEPRPAPAGPNGIAPGPALPPDAPAPSAAAEPAPGVPAPAKVRPQPVVHAEAVGRLSREDALIHRVFAPIATHPGAFGLTDDAAALAPPPGCELVVTIDTLVAGVHFFADDPPAAIARKALRVNLSDLAAKAADPFGFVISTALPEGLKPEWLDAFARGLAEDATAFGFPLFGGDTVRTPGPLTLTVTAFGTAPAGGMVRRAGAEAGDWVVVSGTIGDAALGLALRRHLGPRGVGRLGARDKAHLAERYLLPQPRTRLTPVLRRHVRAAMDVSDGLAGDLAKMCALSGVGARIETALLPLSPAASAAVDADPNLLERIVTGGDDYELLMAVASGELDAFMAAAAKVGVPVTAIGEITPGPGLPVFYGPEGPMKLKQMSFSHF